MIIVVGICLLIELFVFNWLLMVRGVELLVLRYVSVENLGFPLVRLERAYDRMKRE